MSQPLVINVTGAGSGFGALTARKLALQGHIVYVGLRILAPNVISDINKFNAENGVDLRPLQQDMLSDDSVSSSVKAMLDQAGRVDAIVHNCGHMVYGPLEAFTPNQLAHMYDVNVLSTQRLNRAVLPHMRERGSGLLVWVGSSSVQGAVPAFLAPYFAAKAGMDALALSYELELSQWGIESCLVVPGAFSKGTNHFKTAGQPEDQKVVDEYRAAGSPYHGVEKEMGEAWAAFEPPTADVVAVADEIARVVGSPHGSRPRKTHIDPAQDGSEVVSAVRERIRADALERAGFSHLLRVRKFE